VVYIDPLEDQLQVFLGGLKSNYVAQFLDMTVEFVENRVVSHVKSGFGLQIKVSHIRVQQHISFKKFIMRRIHSGVFEVVFLFCLSLQLMFFNVEFGQRVLVLFK